MARFRSTLTALVLSLALLPMGAAAVPADTTDAPTPEALVQAELTQALTTGSVEQQERAARRIRAYAHTHRYDEAVFRDLVRPLHDLVATGRTDEVRVTAISALSAIGTDVAMIGLQTQADEIESARLAQALEAAFDRYAADHLNDTRRTQVIE